MTPPDQTCEHTPEDEAALIKAARTDPQALSSLYRRHYAAIYGYVHRRLGNTADTNDVVADTFLVMVRYLPRYRWTGAPFRAWLLRLATTQITRWARRRRWFRFWRQIDEAGDLAAQTTPEQDPRVAQLRDALWKLPANYQSVLALHYFEGESLDSISQILECPLGTVKSRLARGRNLLKSAFTLEEETSQHEQRPIGWVAQQVEVQPR
jgi:RNA polymerase sigma-70 factor (ECF subfamily)